MRSAVAQRAQLPCALLHARSALARRLRARCAGAAAPPAAVWRIRPAVPGNAEEIERILAECGSRRVSPGAPQLMPRLSRRPARSWGARQVAEELVRPMARVLVAASETSGESPEQLLGVAVAWRVAGDAQVMELAVRPAWRRRGLGGALLDAVCAAASDETGACLLELRESNAGAAALYERHGFVRVGLRKKYYKDNGEAAILMTRPAPAPVS